MQYRRTHSSPLAGSSLEPTPAHRPTENEPHRRRALVGLLAVLAVAGAGVLTYQATRASTAVSIAVTNPPRLTAGIDPVSPLVLSSTSGSASPDSLSQAEMGRRALGLRSDPGYVQQLLSSGAMAYDTVPVSPSEGADLSGRAKNADTVSVVENYARANAPSTYAGVYAVSPGKLVVQFTDDPAPYAAAIDQLVVDPSVLTYQQVSFSSAHLRDVEADLIQRLANAQLAVNPVSGLTIDVPSDRVIVAMTTNDPRVRALLADPAATFSVTGS